MFLIHCGGVYSNNRGLPCSREARAHTPVVLGTRAEVDSKGRQLRTRAFLLLCLSSSEGQGVFREHYVWLPSTACSSHIAMNYWTGG